MDVVGDPLVLKEGQQCEFSQRRNRADGFVEEAIVQLLCTSGQDFARTAAERWVRIMRTNMTTLTQTWMTLLLSNVLPSDVSQFIQGNFQRKCLIDFFYYFIQRYFDYFIIILPFFWFNRGYSVNDRLDFALMVIT